RSHESYENLFRAGDAVDVICSGLVARRFENGSLFFARIERSQAHEAHFLAVRSNREAAAGADSEITGFLSGAVDCFQVIFEMVLVGEIAISVEPQHLSRFAGRIKQV